MLNSLFCNVLHNRAKSGLSVPLASKSDIWLLAFEIKLFIPTSDCTSQKGMKQMDNHHIFTCSCERLFQLLNGFCQIQSSIPVSLIELVVYNFCQIQSPEFSLVFFCFEYKPQWHCHELVSCTAGQQQCCIP